MTDQRHALLIQFATSIDKAARAGAFGDKPINVKEIGVIAGPRAGALEMNAGLDAGRLLRVLQADDGAIVRQFIPWAFPFSPAVYMAGRFVRVEAGWPDHLARRAIKVSDLGAHPYGSGRWCAGINELGRTVTLGLSDNAPHFLIAGTTGAGKSVALRSMVTQLAQNGDRLILIDGKFGEGLRGLDHLPNVIGPLAVDIEAARGALAWAVAEMTRRYEQVDTQAARLVVVVDEVQELATDAAIVEMIRRIAAQGRAARVSVILATQHPNTDAFGGDPSIKRNVTGRVALRVSDYKASEIVIGGNSPRADWLLGAGDAFCVVPGAVQRTQIAYLERREIERLLTATPAINEWPMFEAAQLDGAQPGAFGPRELAGSLLAAARSEGRPTMIKRLAMRDGDRARRLHKLGREIHAELEAMGGAVCLSDADTGSETGTDTAGRPTAGVWPCQTDRKGSNDG